MKSLILAILLSLSCLTEAKNEAKSVCYPDIGCFNDEAPFDDLPLPMDPAVIAPKWHLYQAGQNSRVIQSVDELNVEDLIVLTHGFAGNYENTEWHQLIAKSLLEVRPTADVLFVEWEKGAAFGSGLKMYTQPASNTRVIGALIAQFLRQSPIFNSTKVHCIGFSLGSHVCGFAGKSLPNRWGRLSALDPALPNFDKDDASARVDKTDAAYVDVVHTSWVGLQRPVGHVDFWVNGGKRQPGCVTRRRRSADLLSGNPLPYDYMRGRSVASFDRVEENAETEEEESNEVEVGSNGMKQNKGLVSGIVDGVTDFFGCSHTRAPEVFAATITAQPGCEFLFCPCASKKDFDKDKCNSCDPEVGQYMGYRSFYYPNRGDFWGKTEKKAPFCIQN